MSSRLRDLFVSPFVRIDPATGGVIGTQLVFDGPDLLREAMETHESIEAMSRENEATDAGPWRAALLALTASAADHNPEGRARRRGWALVVFAKHAKATARDFRKLDAHPLRSFVEAFSDGDRPADLTDAEIVDAATQSFEHRAARRTPEGQWLAWREGIYYFGCDDGVLETHATVHRALAGEDYATRYERIKRAGGVITETTATEAQTGPTIGGCPWCKEATR